MRAVTAPTVAAAKPTSLFNTHAARIAVAIRYAFARGRVAVNAAALEKSSSKSQAASAMRAAPAAVRTALLEVLPKALSAALQAGGEASVARLAPRLKAASLRTARHAGLTYVAKHADAVTWVRAHSLELAKGLSETTRQRIEDALVKSFEGGGKRALYREILDAVGDKDRAHLIADHESRVAINQGELQSWQQATEQGFLTGKEQKTWRVQVGACDFCLELEGESVPLDEDFSSGDDMPPAHPRCNCEAELTS